MAILGSRLTDAELEKIDLVLLGIKSWDPERIAAYRKGYWPNAGFCASPGREKADMGALRVGARIDRRRQGHCQIAHVYREPG